MAHTSNLAPGARVIVRDEEWLVRGRRPLRQGGDAVRVIGLSELVRGHEACFLSSLDDITEMRPEDTALVADDSPYYRRSRLYLESLLRRTPPTDERLYLGHQAAMRAMQYQLDPAEKALKALRPRILIADGVGLGKTLEVGVLLSELMKRGRGERILVVAIKSMLAQFQQELWQRFCIPLVRLDSVGLQRVRAKIPANKNPFYHYNRAIISVDTLKNDGRYRHYLEQANWDVIVIDECQNVANANTQRNRVAELLARTSDSLILTSATPHNGRPESFARLMNMLEPTAIANDRDYTQGDIEGLYVRRFKKDVAAEATAEFAERDEDLIKFDATPREEAALRAIYDLEFHTLNGKSHGRDVLFRHTLLKGFLSSPHACAETIRARLKRLEERLGTNPANADGLRNDQAALRLLLPTIDEIGSDDFSRYRALKDELTRIGWTGRADSPRVIIFSERKASLRFLLQRIMADFRANAASVAQFDAGLPDVEQQRLVESFGSEDSKLRMLLCTDVASEGINLHFFCHHLIHWDISWSLITTAQRNGRIDRFGQDQRPVVRYLMLSTGDERVRGDLRIIERLIEKEQEAEKNIGDAAVILGLYDAQAEEDRVQAAMAAAEDPEDVFQPQPSEEEAVETVDFFELMLRDPTPPDRSAERCADPATLYVDDLDFTREAFEEIAARDPLFIGPDFHPEQPSFTFTAPEDLRERCHFMPQEAIPERWEFLLTTDRQAVMRSIEAARQEERQWPKMHLLWEPHPVMQWLIDKVLVGFQRNEAPVLLTGGLGDGDGLYMFQGILSNRRAQPLIAEWFGLLWHDGKLSGEVWSLERTLDTVGLRERPTNPGRVSRTAPAMQSGLLGAVAAARAHMDQARQERSEQMQQRLAKDMERLRSWRSRALSAIESPQTLFPELESPRLPRPVLERNEERRRHVQRLYDAREADLDNTFRAEPIAYVRLAAVFCAE